MVLVTGNDIGEGGWVGVAVAAFFNNREAELGHHGKHQ